MATLLTKTTTVFGRTEPTSDGGACFEQLSDASMPRPLRAVFIPKPLFEELGKPDVITITVEPGVTNTKHKEST